MAGWYAMLDTLTVIDVFYKSYVPVRFTSEALDGKWYNAFAWQKY